MFRQLFIAFIFASQSLAFTLNTNNVYRSSTELSVRKVREVKNVISNLNKENFASSIAEVEPYLLNEAGSSIYKKSIRRITIASKSFGVDVPKDFAKAAKCTEKRREKQNAFIQQKEQERMEAEAAAASEESEAAVEESVEEPELVAA